MSLLKTVVSWFERPAVLYPESLWTVSVEAEGIRATDQTGATMFASTENLTSVAIETNDSGPWGADVWWLLFGKDGQLACAFPQGATGEKVVLDQLMALPEFDQGETMKAMGCTSNATFIVWQRKA